MRHAFAAPESPEGGFPLNEDTFSEMDHAEVEFWKGFIQTARVILGSVEDNVGREHVVPTPTFQAMYERALRQYDGKIYRPLRQLEKIFDFQPAN